MAENLPIRLTEHRARDLTERIRAGVDGLREMLIEARQGAAHVVLGYKTWEEYVQTEFGMSRGNAWRVLTEVQVVGEIAEAARIDPVGVARRDMTQRKAVRIKPQLDEVTETLREQTKGKHEQTRERIAAEVIEAATHDPMAPGHVALPLPPFKEAEPTVRELSALNTLEQIVRMDPARLVKVAGIVRAAAIERSVLSFMTAWTSATHPNMSYGKAAGGAKAEKKPRASDGDCDHPQASCIRRGNEKAYCRICGDIIDVKQIGA